MNIRKLMKQAEAMQQQMQEQMAELEVEASVGEKASRAFAITS